MRIHSFPPIANADSRVLILGTMPGVESLRRQEYYAHPQNAFWKIMGDILRIAPDSAYAVRTSALAASGLALWDVLKACSRVGSLDSNIDSRSEAPNDFERFFADHPRIHTICFNGAKARALFLKHVRPGPGKPSMFKHIPLPSTSPANASISLAQKRLAWKTALRDV